MLTSAGTASLYLKSCLPPLAGGRGTTFPKTCLPACGGRGTTKWWKGVAPSGRCLRSGHKNSVKGKGAIKHKGAPTIIYHCTDAPFRLASLATHPPKWGWARNMEAPFRLAPLATHPLSGGGQEKHGGPLPSRSARHPPPKWGWARNMEVRSDNSKPFLPVIVRWEWEGRPKAADGRVTGGRRSLLKTGNSIPFIPNLIKFCFAYLI